MLETRPVLQLQRGVDVRRSNRAISDGLRPKFLSTPWVEMRAFFSLADEAGWRADRVMERLLSYDVSLVKG
jgi:hypothetical protein